MPLKLQQKGEEAAPYTRLSKIYDFLMRHVDYDMWANYLLSVFGKADRQVENVLDLSCGTGNLMWNLAHHNIKCFGFDYSRQMVALAKARFRKSRQQAGLWVGDMSKFQTRTRYDAIFCTYDSINYCLDFAALQQVLRCGADALQPGGLFVFDVSTLRNSKRYFRNYFDENGNSDFNYSRKSYFLRSQKLQVNEFLMTFADIPGKSFVEVHRQRIYSLKEVEKNIPMELYSLVAIYDGFSFRTGTEKSCRVHFVLKRK